MLLKTKTLGSSRILPLVLVATLLMVFTYFAFALPSVTFQPPTLSDNATTGLNWVYVNVTSSEDLNQSLLEWGNSTGFTNITMTNVSGMQNWYVNMTGLADGTYNYTVWVENTTGAWNQTQRRFVYIDTTPPYSIYACQGLTIAGGSYILVQNVSSSGTCFNVLANNVTLDGAGYWVNYSQSVAGYGVNITGRNNITVKNLNVVQGNGGVTSAYGIYGQTMTNSTIVNNTVTTSGSNGYGIYLFSSSSSNNVSNNTVTTTGSAVGIFIYTNSKSNILSSNNIIAAGSGMYFDINANSNTLLNNNIVSTSTYGIYLYGANNNSISGGSVSSRSGSSYDYYLRTGAGSTNNFTDTNFTALRRIYFYDSSVWFNYNNQSSGNIWLKTNVSTASREIRRTFITWSQSEMKWNDTNYSGQITANYNITGLQANALYKVYNTSAGTQTNPYSLTADSAGAISFTIALNGATEIIVNTSGTDAVPTVILNSPIDNFNQTSASITFNCTAYDDLNLTNVTLYNNFNGWQANGTNSSGINNTAYTFDRVIPSNGTFTWNCLAYDNSSQSSFASQNFTITVDGVPPTSNSPLNASYTQNSSATIGWILYDNYAGGYYTVYRNGTIQNQSNWANNTNLNIWVNTSAQGTWNYTITYNDSLGNNGVPNAVIINITGDLSAPKYSLNSTNSTVNGTSVMHSLYWTDDISLSGYIFSFDNGNGTFYNDSWVQFSGTGNWSNVTKTVNSTIGALIQWKFYANDTGNNWNASLTYSYNTTSAPPTSINITSWYTNATNASSSTDTMFLVNQSDSIKFNITIDGTADRYTWLANKIDQNRNANNFTFTVPACDHANDPSSCIWEIHVIANDSSGNEAHKEWVVSNLTAGEAPDFFDYFTDADRNINNTGIYSATLDPWNRPLGNYTFYSSYSKNASLRYNALELLDAPADMWVITPTNVSYGTWKFRYGTSATTILNDGKGGTILVGLIYPDSIPWTNGSRVFFDKDAYDHTGLFGRRDNSYFGRNIMNSNLNGHHIANLGDREAGKQTVANAWYDVTIIRTPDNYWYAYLDGLAFPEGFGYDPYNVSTKNFGLTIKREGLNSSELSWFFDNVAIYSERYLYPIRKNATYSSATNTINVSGFNVTLLDINASINNATIFSYNASSRTAVANANLDIQRGAIFRMNNETLLINGTSDAQYEIKVRNAAYLEIFNSVISSASGKYYKWKFMNTYESKEFLWNYNTPYNFHGAFVVKNSTINDSGYLYILSPARLEWENSNFTNIVNHSGKGILIAPRLAIGSFIVDNMMFSGKYGNASVSFEGGDAFYDNRIRNSVFSNITLTVGHHLSNTQDITYRPFNRTVSLVNSRSDNNTISFGIFNCTNNAQLNCVASMENTTFFAGGKLKVKYYLDVFVKDASGTPLSGAIVNISSENCVACTDLIENMIPESFVDTKPSYEMPAFNWAGGNDPVYAKLNASQSRFISSTRTTDSGRTPLPSNTTDTIILTDFVLMFNETSNQTYTVNYTYTITAYDPSNIWTNVTHTIYPNGTISQLQPLANVTGVNPDSSWYRPNPNIYQNTTNLTINYTKTNLTIAVSNTTNITVSEYSSSKINFTATNTTANQKMNITVSNSTFQIVNGQQYTITKNGVLQTTQAASSNQVIFTEINVGSEYIIESAGNNITVTLNSPSNSLLTNNATVTFNCSASSGNPLVNITLYTNASGWSQKNSTNITGTSNSSQWINALADGSYIWNCLAYDNTGNSSFAQSNYTFIVDTVAPSLVLVLPANTTYSSANRTLNFTATDGGSGINTTWYQYNGINTTLSGNISFTALNNQQSTLILYANDSAGNINSTNVTFTISSPPVISVQSPLNQTYNTISIWFNITLNEAGSWAGYSLDGAANVSLTNSTGNWNNFSTVAEGFHNVTFYANDTTGNMNQSALVYFTVDTVPPIITIAFPQNMTYNSATRTLNFTAIDAISNISTTWYQYNGTNATITGNISFTAIDNNQSTLVLYANDSAGNMNSTNITFTVDTLNPQISFTTGTEANNSFKSRSWIWANVSITETNFKNLTFSLYNATLVNATAFTNSTREMNWTDLADGAYYYNATVYDMADNVNSTETRIITLDTIKPALFFVNITPNNTQTTNNWAYINITSSESLSTALLEWNNTAPNITMQGSGTNWYYNKTELVNGNYTFKVYANDTAGSWNNTETRWVYVNYTAGYPQYSSVAVNTTQRNNPALFAAYWNDDIGLSAYIFSINNSGAWTNYSSNFSGTGNWSNYTITLNSTIGLTVGYIFYANNTNNNWNNTGINTLVTGCMESWTYSAWSTCSGGTQTRTASDANSCGTTVNQSALSQSCTSDTGGTGSSGSSSSSSSSVTTTRIITVAPDDMLTKVTVNLNSDATSPSIAVATLSSAPTNVPSVAEPAYQYLNITKSNFNNSQIENATIEFKVNRSWILANNFTNISLARYENGWSKLRTELINSTSAYNSYRAYTNSFSYFAIIGETRDAKSLCTENWSCSEWSDCKNDRQARICKDLNNCNTTASKPEDSQACKVEKPTTKLTELPVFYIAIAAVGIIAILAGILYLGRLWKGKVAKTGKRRSVNSK